MNLERSNHGVTIQTGLSRVKTDLSVQGGRDDDSDERIGSHRSVGHDARPERRTWSRRTSFWLVVATQVVVLAASNFPTPLFPIYASATTSARRP